MIGLIGLPLSWIFFVVVVYTDFYVVLHPRNSVGSEVDDVPVCRACDEQSGDSVSSVLPSL